MTRATRPALSLPRNFVLNDFGGGMAKISSRAAIKSKMIQDYFNYSASRSLLLLLD